MRPAKIVTVAAVTIATTLSLLPVEPVAPVADAQTEAEVTKEDGWKAVERPPAYMKDGFYYLLINGVYVRVDQAPGQPFPPVDRGDEDDNAKPDPGSGDDGSSSGNVGKVMAWLAPLLIIGGVVATIAAVIRHQFPTGRLMVYFQPSDHVGHTFG